MGRVPDDDEKLGLYKIRAAPSSPGAGGKGSGLDDFRRCVNLEQAERPAKGLSGCADCGRPLRQHLVDGGRRPGQSAGAETRLVAGGAQLKPFSPAIYGLALLQKAATELHNEVAATNADLKEVLDAMLAFRNDEYLWWQIAEYSYDSYMIRARARG